MSDYTCHPVYIIYSMYKTQHSSPEALESNWSSEESFLLALKLPCKHIHEKHSEWWCCFWRHILYTVMHILMRVPCFVH